MTIDSDPTEYSKWYEALKYATDKGSTVVISAGNEDADLGTHLPLPAAFSSEIDGVISVAAVANTGDISSYSNYGSLVTIAAPGGDDNGNYGSAIISTAPNSSYEELQGTSMASPVVAGAAALIKAVNPRLRPNDVESILTNSADKYRELSTLVEEGNYLNLKDAVSLAQTYEATPEPTLDTALTLTETENPNLVQSIDDITEPQKISTFVLKDPIDFGNQSVVDLIVGTRKKDKIRGSMADEVLTGGKGKDVLKGGAGSDGFLFNAREFGKKRADKIIDFNPDENDSILIDQGVYDLGKKLKLKTVSSQKELKKASKTKNPFVYDDKTGFLYFNEDSKGGGWGDGGLFAILQGKPELSARTSTIGVIWKHICNDATAERLKVLQDSSV